MNTKITTYNMVRAINNLPKNKNYNYINPRTPGLIHIEEIVFPAGPIYIKRWNPNKGEAYENAKREPISSEMMWRIANAVSYNEPINIDRILGASYNTRSVFESLLAHTPEFYYCYPGRIQDIDGKSTIEKGHKHIIWRPDKPHQNAVLEELKIENMAISEIPIRSVTYENLILPSSMTVGGDLDISVVRRHTQIQIALYLIGLQLGYRTWIAQNDKGIIYNDKPLIQQSGIISELSSDDNVVSRNPEAVPAAAFIDCIWFQNHRFMPAVMEVEHTTGVTSGLTRMKGLQDAIPAFATRFVIVAPDEDREKVIYEANREQFRCLDARFFPYSSVEELYYICTHRNLHGVNQEFLDCYMEKVLV